jgi:hypothetical protein
MYTDPLRENIEQEQFETRNAVRNVIGSRRAVGYTQEVLRDPGEHQA